MWSDNDIDNAFQRLNPPEPEPAPFPLDAWLRLETQLDKEEVARTVRRKLWRFFAAEVLIVALVGLGWLLWKPAGPVAPAASQVAATGATRSESQRLSASVAPQPSAASGPRSTASASALSAPKPAAPAANTPFEASAAAASATSEPASATARAATANNRHLALASRIKPALAVAAATPRLHPTPERRVPTEQANRPASAAALPSAGARHAGRRAKEQARRSHWGNISAPSVQREPQAISEATTPDASATAFVGAGRPNRNTRPQQRHEGLISPETQVTPVAASAAASGHTTESGLAEADNTELAPKPAIWVTPTTKLPASLALVAETKPAVLAPEPRFFIGLVGAPDVSTVKFVSIEKPLLNVGLTLEYRFTNRLRVSTGLLRANKEYYARREDYDWTNYPRAQARDITWVEGKCTVLDVPLNLRYDAVVRDNARWFGSAGLSSFFMHRENYSYDYLEGGDYKLWEMPGLVNANQHLFSVLNLSAGYERSLGQHWRLQAEPYVKMPLGGVGAGKVKLTSAGVFLGVKYGF